MRIRTVVAALCAAALVAGVANAAEKKLLDSLKSGTPELKQAGPIAFAPEGILLVGDSLGAAVLPSTPATGPAKPADGDLKVEGINEKIAGIARHRGQAGHASTAWPSTRCRATPTCRSAAARARMRCRCCCASSAPGKIEELELKDVKFAKAALPNAAGRRQEGRPRQSAPHRRHHQPRLRRWQGLRRRPVERGVLVEAARHSVPVQRGRQGDEHRDLSRLAQADRDELADPHVRALQGQRSRPTCWPPTPARRW